MSGPKAFAVVAAPAAAVSVVPIVVVIAAAALLIAIANHKQSDESRRREREKQLRKQEAERKAEQERLRRIAIQKAAAEETERKRVLAADLLAIVTNCEVEFAASEALLDGRFSRLKIIDELATVQNLAKASEAVADVKSAADRFNETLAEHIDCLREFREAEAECEDDLAAAGKTESVSKFSRDAMRQLKLAHAAILSGEHMRKNGPAATSEELRKISEKSKTLITDSLTKQSHFEVRNKLLETTINALKSLGFFVQDPQFATPNDPLGAVSLVATRGPERVVLSVPIGLEVQSDWQGVPEEPCKADFFAFLEKLEESGFPARPTRPDLQNRPKLLQRGAKSIPGTTGQQRNA
jgi:hypothetical protein